MKIARPEVVQSFTLTYLNIQKECLSTWDIPFSNSANGHMNFKSTH